MPANHVHFGPGTTVTHTPAPAYQPPPQKTGVVLDDGRLRVTAGGYSVVYSWSPTWAHWEAPVDWRRVYWSDGFYELYQGEALMERGTWTAVGG